MNAYETLVERCGEVEFVATSGIVEGLRIVKDPHEIEITRRAVRVAERAFESLLPMLSPEWSERQVAHELEAKMRLLGAEGCSFAPIVAFGAAGALPHYEPTDRLLGAGPALHPGPQQPLAQRLGGAGHTRVAPACGGPAQPGRGRRVHPP